MARDRAHNNRVSEGLYKRCARALGHDWKKCDCPWQVRHRASKASLSEFWKLFKKQPKVATSYSEAQEMARVFQTAVDKNEWPLKRHQEDQSVTVKAVMKIFLADQKDLHSDGKGFYLRAFTQEFGNEKLAEMPDRQVAIATWLTRLQGEREWKGCTYNAWRGAISNYFDYCATMYHKVCTRNPMIAIKKKDYSGDRIVRIEMAEQMVNQFGLAQDMRRRLMAALDLGMRSEEMRNTRVRHVNAVGDIVLPALLTKGGKLGKSKEPITFHVMSPRLQREIAKRTSLAPEAFLFGRDDGSFITDKAHIEEWHGLFAAHGLKPEQQDDRNEDGTPIGRRWHDLRHEFCFRMASNPALHQTEKMKAMRVKDLKTFNIYYKPDDAQVREAFASVNRFIEDVG